MRTVMMSNGFNRHHVFTGGVCHRRFRLAVCVHTGSQPTAAKVQTGTKCLTLRAKTISQSATGRLSRRTDGSNITNPSRHQNHPRSFSSPNQPRQNQAIALRRMMRRTLCLNARTPPKNFSSDFESESPQSIRNEIKRKLQTRSAT